MGQIQKKLNLIIGGLLHIQNVKLAQCTSIVCLVSYIKIYWTIVDGIHTGILQISCTTIYSRENVRVLPGNKIVFKNPCIHI